MKLFLRSLTIAISTADGADFTMKRTVIDVLEAELSRMDWLRQSWQWSAIQIGAFGAGGCEVTADDDDDDDDDES